MTFVARSVPVSVRPVVLVDAQITETVAGPAADTVTSVGGIQTMSSRRLASGSLTDGQAGVNRLAPEPGERVQFRTEVVVELVPPVTKMLPKIE